MSEPVVLLGESLVDAVIEVLVVGEYDVAADIVQLVGRAGQLTASMIAAGVDIRSPPGSRRCWQDHRPCRPSRQSAMTGHSAKC